MDKIFSRESFAKEKLKVSDESVKAFYGYKELLVEWNNKINLTSILESKEIFYKHFVDSLLIMKVTEVNLEGKSMIDVGTGAGFPGLPLAIANKNLKVTLTDSLKKRLVFLDVVTQDLGLNNVDIVWGRAEDLGKDLTYREQYDLAVARAVSKLPTLLEYTLPFVKPGGFFIAYKGPDYQVELEESEKALDILGGRLHSIKNFKLKEMTIERNIIIFEKYKSTPNKYPRPAGTPQRKPL